MEKPILTISRIWLAGAALALLQACALQPLPTHPAPAPARAPVPAPAAQRAAPPAPAPAPAAAPAVVKVPVSVQPLDASKLPPFDGERVVVEDRLRRVTKIDRTVKPDDLWQRIRQGFAMPDLDNALVRRETAAYAKNPEYLQQMFDRSRLYLYHIVQEIQKRGLPTEIALLPMVESAFNPMAYSRAHASGLWQFIPGTGKRYDLTQNWWYDGRRDVVDSTTAALDYLTYLYEMHGDWHLALASYNWGENAVARAIARNRRAHKPTDYSHLRMPRETRHYVPKLQALKNIISNPEPYGIDLDPIPNSPYFAVVTDAPDIDVDLAAKLAEMPLEQFMALNPGFSRPLIRASEETRIVLPADKVDVFHENLEKADEKSLVSWQVYHPRRHERLGRIAKKFHISIAKLKRVNGIRRRSWRVPRVLIVPLKPGSVSEKVLAAYAPSGGRDEAPTVYVVRRGDTLSGIAERFGVRLSQLRRMNHLGRVLRIGQRIRLRPRPYYIVRSGDTLSEIAERYHVGVSDLRRWNDLGPVLRIGQKIHVRQTDRS